MAWCTSCKPFNGPMSVVLAKQSGTAWLGVQVASHLTALLSVVPAKWSGAAWLCVQVASHLTALYLQC